MTALTLYVKLKIEIKGSYYLVKLDQKTDRDIIFLVYFIDKNIFLTLYRGLQFGWPDLKSIY